MDTQRTPDDLTPPMTPYHDTPQPNTGYMAASQPLQTALHDATGNLLIDLPQLWAIFRRRLGLFLIGAVVVTALVGLITFQMTPQFRATAMVKLDTSETGLTGLDGMIPGFSGDSALVDTEVELIGSRTVATKVVEKLDLYNDPEFNGALQPPSGLANVKAALKSVFPPQVSGKLDEAALARVEREKTVDKVLSRLNAEREGLTYIIAISFESEDPGKAALIANTFADTYLVQQLDAKFDQLQRNQRLLADRLSALQEDVRLADAAVEAYREENNILVSEGSTLTEQRISDIQSRLVDERAVLAEREAKLASVNLQLESGENVESIAEVLQSPVISALRAQQSDLSRRRSELSTRYGPKHPRMAEIDTEETNLTAQIDAEVRRIVNSLTSEVNVARRKVAQLQASLNSARDELAVNSRAMVELNVLQRKADAAREIYESALMNSKSNTERLELTNADGEIASAANIPTEPSFPNKMLNLLLGAILGSGFGALLVLLAEVFDNGLRTADDIERHLNLPLLTAVPSLSRGLLSGGAVIAAPEDYLVDRPLSSFAEAYRTIRSALMISNGAQTKPKVVAMTSALSGEGKTASALCLGRISALSGDKVIVIDCDARRRILSNTVEKVETGLVEVLTGQAPLRDAIRKDRRSELDILPVAGPNADMADIFGSNAFDAMINKLKTKYDLIILDTPPITAVADTRTVVRDADAAIMIVRWRNTSAKIARSARKILQTLPTPVIGAVLTQVDAKSQTQYGYEGSYKYYKEHQRYYHD